MNKPIRFTQHARQKFIDLAEAGFFVVEAQVIDVVRNPDYIRADIDPPIAQKSISDRHLLRMLLANRTRNDFRGKWGKGVPFFCHR